MLNFFVILNKNEVVPSHKCSQIGTTKCCDFDHVGDIVHGLGDSNP